MTTALVSILMPAFNEEKFIGEAITSILNQTYQNWELLILDDKSTDSTMEVIESFSDNRIRCLTNERNLGYLKSCNRLFNEVKGEYVTFLDADDTCPSNRLDLCLGALITSGCDYLTSDYVRQYQTTGISEIQHSIVDHKRLSSDTTYYPSICCATVFAKSDLVASVGGYSEIFTGHGAEDYHWVFKLSRYGSGIHVSENLYTYRMHENQIRNSSTSSHFIAHDLDRVIRVKLMEQGIDWTESRFNDKVNQLKLELLQPYQKDRCKLLRDQAIQELNRGNWKASTSLLLAAIRVSPTSLKNWQQLAYVWYVMLRRRTSGNS